MLRRVLLALTAAAVLASGPDDFEPRQLQLSSNKTFSLPAFSAWGLPLNDEDGDFFFISAQATI